MKQVVGYIVRKGLELNSEIIAATGDANEAWAIAESNRAVAYKVVTTIKRGEDPSTVTTVFHDNAPCCMGREFAIVNA